MIGVEYLMGTATHKWLGLTMRVPRTYNTYVDSPNFVTPVRPEYSRKLPSFPSDGAYSIMVNQENLVACSAGARGNGPRMICTQST